MDNLKDLLNGKIVEPVLSDTLMDDINFIQQLFYFPVVRANDESFTPLLSYMHEASKIVQANKSFFSEEAILRWDKYVELNKSRNKLAIYDVYEVEVKK